MPKMIPLIYFLLVFIAVSILANPLPVQLGPDPTDVGLSPKDMVIKHGYPFETHHVTTEDGYIITLFRIPFGKNQFSNGANAVNRAPVLVVHGMMASSADHLYLGPGNSIGYMLADAGYDVWLSNVRGTTFSKNHTKLSILHREYWQYSWHEIGYYDHPATIDYILEKNGDKNLYYVGHSQGGTSMAVLLTTRPEYNEKLRFAALMAPAIFLEHNDVLLFKLFIPYMDDILALLDNFGIYQAPFLNYVRALGPIICSQEDYKDICVDLLKFIMLLQGDFDEEEFIREMLPVMMTNTPNDISAKQIIHFGQQIRDGGFKQYDFGKTENLQRYGSESPPHYNLSAITIPITIFYGDGDHMVNPKDIDTAIKSLPNAKKIRVAEKKFDHFDFVVARDVAKLVHVDLINELKRH